MISQLCDITCDITVTQGQGSRCPGPDSVLSPSQSLPQHQERCEPEVGETLTSARVTSLLRSTSVRQTVEHPGRQPAGGPVTPSQPNAPGRCGMNSQRLILFAFPCFRKEIFFYEMSLFLFGITWVIMIWMTNLESGGARDKVNNYTTVSST